MDHLDISCCRSVVTIFFFKRVGTWAINNILFKKSLFDQVRYLLLWLEAILGVVPVVSVELIILVLVPFMEFGLDLLRPLYEFLVLDLCEYLGYGSIDMRQYQVSSPRVRFLSLVIVSYSPFALGLDQLFCGNVLVSFALECRLSFRNVP
ncbi:hypothetical protein Acr_27g0000310 [Actinidia rufa]|uniref:Uncharacterized protein n=1 Tax=Actinidia rufa TaxID=165716 RepID=A0A7J0H5E6_9ERIC|nr:hypothetical protein Acr_27g0000310 [Actinidia rufa]